MAEQQIEDVERLAEAGATRGEEATMLGIPVDSLQRRLKDQLEVFAALARAGARMKASLPRKQLAIVLNDKHPARTTMLVWRGKVILGQTERVNSRIETPAAWFPPREARA